MSSEPNNHPPSATTDDHEVRRLPPVQVKPPPSSSLSFSSLSFSTPPSTSSATPYFSTPIASAQRRIAIAMDLSDESAYAVKWAVENYLRPGDAVVLLHIRPTSILYGADWGSTTPTFTNAPPPSPSPAAFSSTTPQPHHQEQKLEEDFDSLTNTKTARLAQPLVDAHIPFKIHIVKDHDLKERLCLEVERFGPSAVIMGSRGFGASRRSAKGRLGSVSDYCVHHCVCPVVVVRYLEDGKERGSSEVVKKVVAEDLRSAAPEDQEQEFHDAGDDMK